MFQNVEPVTARPVQSRMPVTPSRTGPTQGNKPVFGLTTISMPQTALKVGPITPKPSVHQTVGSRLDYYA